MIDRSLQNFLRAVSVFAFAIFFLQPSAARAQTQFQPLTALNTKSVTLPAGNTPLGVAVADFNHDGYPDLVVANNADNTISVYLSTASGTLAAPVTYPTCGGPTAVLAKDLDLTSLPDIVVTCNTPASDVIQVFLNLGDGTFDPTMGDGIHNIVLGTGKGPVALVSGDFNNDGHPDIAVANKLDGTVTLFLSDASNNFTYYTVKTLSGFGTPTAIADGHFSASGNLDLAVADASSNTVHILTGNGAGNFTPGATPATGSSPAGMVAGDFNRDGITDLAVVNAGDGTVRVLLGQGGGNFSTSKPIKVGPATGTGASSIIAVDTRSNGILDLITGNTAQNTFGVLLGKGNGRFQAVQTYAVPNGPGYLAVGDSIVTASPIWQSRRRPARRFLC